jgi:hypothetical protein
MTFDSRRLLLWLASASFAVARPAAAQWQANTGPGVASLGAVVGSDVERYLRALILAGIVEPLPWSARPFSRHDLSETLERSVVKPHPWKGSLRAQLARRGSLVGVGYASANSSFAWGANDGAMWQGRGMNVGVGIGAALKLSRFVSLVAAPAALGSQNAKYPILRPPVVGVNAYSDPQYPVEVDLPQRMGSKAFYRLVPGESSLRVQVAGFMAGLSTSSIGWGTGEAFPAILGPNAGGFPHVTMGTSSRGIQVHGLGRLTAQYVLGVLDQSPYSNVAGGATYVDDAHPGTRRLGVGVNVSFMPSMVQGLELGASRFFHSPYLAAGSRWDAWSRPFGGIFKKGLSERPVVPTGAIQGADNQLGSFFARWIFPRRGVEANIELLRDDHNWDSRDLAQEPENNSAVLSAIRFTTRRSPDNLAVATLEYFNGDVRPIAQARAQGFLYVHGTLIQGHTLRGQLLGAPLGIGAIAGQRFAWERFTSTGSLRINVQRWRMRSRRTQDVQGLYPPLESPTALPNSFDWVTDVSIGATRLRGSRALSGEAGIAAAPTRNFDTGRTNFYARSTLTFF